MIDFRQNPQGIIRQHHAISYLALKLPAQLQSLQHTGLRLCKITCLPEQIPLLYHKGCLFRISRHGFLQNSKQLLPASAGTLAGTKKYLVQIPLHAHQLRTIVNGPPGVFNGVFIIAQAVINIHHKVRQAVLLLLRLGLLQPLLQQHHIPFGLFLKAGG